VKLPIPNTPVVDGTAILAKWYHGLMSVHSTKNALWAEHEALRLIDSVRSGKGGLGWSRPPHRMVDFKCVYCVCTLVSTLIMILSIRLLTLQFYSYYLKTKQQFTITIRVEKNRGRNTIGKVTIWC
jgi:hypothetical protein